MTAATTTPPSYDDLQNVLIIERVDHAEFVQAEPLGQGRYRIARPPLLTTRCRFLDIVSTHIDLGHVIVDDVLDARGWESYLITDIDLSAPNFIETVKQLDQVGAATPFNTRGVGAIALPPSAIDQGRSIIARAVRDHAFALRPTTPLPSQVGA